MRRPTPTTTTAADCDSALSILVAGDKGDAGGGGGEEEVCGAVSDGGPLGVGVCGGEAGVEADGEVGVEGVDADCCAVVGEAQVWWGGPGGEWGGVGDAGGVGGGGGGVAGGECKEGVCAEGAEGEAAGAECAGGGVFGGCCRGLRLLVISPIIP